MGRGGFLPGQISKRIVNVHLVIVQHASILIVILMGLFYYSIVLVFSCMDRNWP